MSSYYGKGPYGQGLYSLQPDIELAGGLTPLIGLPSAPLSNAVGLSGSLTVAPVLYGTMGNPQSLAGNLAPIVTLNPAAAAPIFAFGGALQPTFALAGGANAAFVMTGDLDVTPALAQSDAGVAPLWTMDTPCPDPGWEPDWVTAEEVL